MRNKLKELVTVSALGLLPTFILWLPFFLRLETIWGIPLPGEGLGTIVANYDGPLFIAAAKSMYVPEIIQQFEFGLPDVYYTAHFPLYPILIRTVASLGINYPYAMLLVTVLSSLLAIYFFRKLAREYVSEDKVLWLSFVFSIFPARWLIVRSVGSAEPLFIASIIASIYYFKKERFLQAGIWGALAQATKSPGILLFVAYIFAIVVPTFKKAALSSLLKWVKLLDLKKHAPLLLIPFSLLAVFVFYYYQTGNFWAYFQSGDNIHVFFPPFQVFNYAQPWVGTFWLEEVIFIYLLGSIGIKKLIDKKRAPENWFTAIFFITILFVSHRDVLRYALPVVPFLIGGFSKYISSVDFKIVLAILIIPIFLFSVTYISQNVMPISDWAPLL